MEVQTAQPSSGSGSSSAAYPRWVILEQHCKSKVDGASWPTAVAKTLAAARTSNGLPIQVSLSLQEPPATSVVCVNLPDGVCPKYCITLAAHGGSLLIEVMIEQGSAESTLDYFVYSVGDAAADPPRPPSLLLLPPYYLSESEDSRYPVNSVLRTDCTGILRRPRGEDDGEVVVAELQIVADDDTPRTEVAELLLFSSGEWSVKRPRIWYGDDEFGELLSLWDWNATSVFPVGDTRLCWADTSNGGGILLWDVLEEKPSPWLQYVPLPTVPSPCSGRKVCASAGGGTLKFVNIFPRCCCCGGAGASYCQRSHHAYTINTWTLRMDGDGGMEWVMDGMVDATELWWQDIYKGLPCVPLGYPVVSMYEAHVICFVLCESHHVKPGGDQTIWLLMVDMRSKTIQSVSCHPDWFSGRGLLTSNVSYYLNPYPTCSSGDDGTSKGQSPTDQMDIVEKKKKGEDDNATNSMLQSICKSAAEPAAQASSDEILAALREIPSYGLAHDDMLKAFLILSGDNGCRRVRSLLRLPKNLRKDWLLMEIKADDAY